MHSALQVRRDSIFNGGAADEDILQSGYRLIDTAWIYGMYIDYILR